MFGKFLRVIGIILMALTAVMTLLGGIGTACVAIDATRYSSMVALADFQWLYILFVLTGVLLGAAGIHATRLLIKSRDNAYRMVIIVLVLSLVVGIIHMLTSRALRGSSMPVDFVVYMTVLTLAVFLLFQIPGIWQKVNLTGKDDHTTGIGAGVAMIVAGFLILTVQIWAGAMHTIDGVNYADVWHTQLAVAGWVASLGGSAILLHKVLGVSLPQPSQITVAEEVIH